MTMPLIVSIPFARAASRAKAVSMPSFSIPSPEISITWRVPRNMLVKKRSTAKSIAEPDAVSPWKGRLSLRLRILEANVWEVLKLLIADQPIASSCWPSLDHNTKLTAISLCSPVVIKILNKSGLSKARAYPSSCNWYSALSTLAEISINKDSSASTGKGSSARIVPCPWLPAIVPALALIRLTKKLSSNSSRVSSIISTSINLVFSPGLKVRVPLNGT